MSNTFVREQLPVTVAIFKWPCKKKNINTKNTTKTNENTFAVLFVLSFSRIFLLLARVALSCFRDKQCCQSSCLDSSFLTGNQMFATSFSNIWGAVDSIEVDLFFSCFDWKLSSFNKYLLEYAKAKLTIQIVQIARQSFYMQTYRRA